MRNVLLMLCAVAVLAMAGLPGTCQQAGTATDRAVLKAVIHAAALGLGAVAVTKDGTCNTALIRQYVDAVRFLDDQSGYFFVYDYTTNFNIAHAMLKDFPGTDRTNYKDSRGLLVIQELSKLAKSKEAAGFLEYYWNNPKSGKEEKKLGYVEVIPGTTLYIGSGIYFP